MTSSLAIHSRDQVMELISAHNHSTAMATHRGDILSNRIYFFAVLFAVLTPAWIVIEALLLPWPDWGYLALGRFLATSGFIVIAIASRQQQNLARSRALLGLLLAIPLLFFIFVSTFDDYQSLGRYQRIDIELYSLLPYVIAAGLSLFPLSLKEFGFYLLPPFLVIVLESIVLNQQQPFYMNFTSLWLFLLIAGISLFSSMNQLRYMISQTSIASYDELTGALTRRAGIEALELQFRLANLHSNNLSLAFIDLDHFKSINDTFGHDAGDQALKSATQKLMDTLRKGDFIVRWGGEEFLVILPGTDEESSRVVIERILHEGLGGRPDGLPLTASIGVSDISHDHARYWKELVELADQRMYQAKQSGRARAINYLEEAMTWAFEQRSDTKTTGQSE